MADDVRLARDQRGWVAWHDAFDLAARGARFEGRLPLAVFPRLSGLLAGDQGEVSARLEFARGGVGMVRVTGHCEGSALLTCQRCLEPYRQPLVSSFELLLVENEAQLEQLDGEEDREVLADRLRAIDLLEDELIMTVPLVPAHADPADCEVLARRLVVSADEPPKDMEQG